MARSRRIPLAVAQKYDVLGNVAAGAFPAIEISDQDRIDMAMWEFRISDPVRSPDSAQPVRERIKEKSASGYVRAYRLPLTDPPEQVGKVNFGVLYDGDIQTVDYFVEKDDRGKAVPLGLVLTLIGYYASHRIVESPGTNTEAGDSMLSRFRARGVRYHYPRCEQSSCACFPANPKDAAETG